ncbi:protein of unknown function [Streptomyces sp. KY75]|nr:protein of unknown function [Streptomyces sp. KY75]CAD5975723.1 protein of unknown function [Streptomyces sp. KY70]
MLLLLFGGHAAQQACPKGPSLRPKDHRHYYRHPLSFS